MHTIDENVILKVVEGKAVVTNLWSYSSPVVLYSLGDYIEVEKNLLCDCGRTNDLVKGIVGRVGQNIYGRNNIYPSLRLY